MEPTVSDGAPVEKDLEGQCEAEVSSEAAGPALKHLEPVGPPTAVEAREASRSDLVRRTPDEAEEAAKVAGDEPPVDWFEPLEDDDYDEESLAGESERSESVAGSETVSKRVYKFQRPCRKRSHPDEGWDEWPILGDGWKRKEVVRRSGSSIGQKDVYYLSPRGDRVRSRVELISLLVGQQDMSTFDYKSGKFYEGEVQPVRIRHRAKRKIRERSSSESSWMERGDGADTPDSQHMPTNPSLGPKIHHSNPTNLSLHSTIGIPNKGSLNVDAPAQDRIKLPLPSSSSRALLLPSINGEVGSEDSTLVCARCGVSFTGTWYDKQRKRPCCPNCWASKSKEHPLVRFRKWIPCGQCVGCHNTANCGQCANCKHGLQSPESKKRLCRKRKCICPIRKGPGGGCFMPQKPSNDIPDMYEDSMSLQSEVTDSQHPSLKSSDTENFSVNVDMDDDDDMSTDDDDDWHKKRKRRSCGECKACLCRKDCGTCDFCVDKPKFGGSNKKRQKCRLRQCQRQAMDPLSRWDAAKSHPSRNSRRRVQEMDDSDDDDDDDDDDGEEAEEDEEEEVPMITQIFSLAETPSGSGDDVESQLTKLLQSLRSSAMPMLWYAIMVEGPQLQLVQCSKQSSLSDTIVLIDPGFCYQVTVQKQPLLPTHPLYDRYPARLTSVTEVVDLLLGLEEYVVCQGLPPREPLSKRNPIILERASTCDFLVKRKVSVCTNCRALQGL
ncbi:methyl-CpG-binding domain protein 1b isoform X5 [Pungitius pungitius]|uniref:methyl-CpG-binding domain protein 1b isoform X5 n=1 Tax=Pungitius pungitius TaxID=134920 RepID=UPI002E0FF709